MTIGPENEREALIHQASYLQGFEDGVKAITVKLREQHLRGLATLTAPANVTPIDKTGTR